MPASTLKVVPVVTVDPKLIPAAVAAITPDDLNTLLVTIPLIILFSIILSYYALNEYPAPVTFCLTEPTAAVSLATTPEFETKLETPEPEPAKNIALSPP